MIAAITAALVTLCNAATAESQTLVRRIHNTTIALVTLDSQMVGRCASAVVPDSLYLESKALYLSLKSPVSATAAGLRPVPPAAAPSPVRHYSTRKALTSAQAADITGLSRSTIRRLDKDPGNTKYPGRNSTPQILAAWAQLYRASKFAAREVRAANRPRLGHGRV